MLSNYRVYGLKPLLSSIVKRDDWGAITPVDVLFVDHDGHRSYRFHERAYAPLIDSMQESLVASGKRCLTIAEPFSQMTGASAFGNVIDFNGSFARAAILRVIVARVASKERVRGTRFLRDVWLRILERARPSRVIAIQPAQALCSACRELGIDVEDLQHGVISNAHPWYGRSFRESDDKDGLPTAFLCWDEASARVVEAWAPAKGIAVRIVGNPWTRRFIERDPSDALVSEATADYAWLRALPPNRILLTLAWGFGDITAPGMPHYLSFPTPLLEVIRDAAPNATWFIRPHPVQMRGPEGAAIVEYLRTNLTGIPNVFWTEVTAAPLPVLLEEADVHLTVGSTVTSEAALFGVPTGLVVPEPRPKSWLEHYYEDERTAGIAEFVPNTTEGLRRYLASKLPELCQGRSATTRNASQA